MLYLVPYQGPENLDPGGGGLSVLVKYLIWLAFDIGILWAPTLFLIDTITRYFGLETRIGKKISNQFGSIMGWGYLVIALVITSVVFDVWTYFGLPDLIVPSF